MKNKNYGIYIPHEILTNTEIDCVDKILLSEIVALHELSRGCIASNEKFSKMLNISTGRVSKRIINLKDLGYLTISLKRNPNKTEQRTIVPTQKVKVVNDHTISRERPSRLVVSDSTISRIRPSRLVVSDSTISRIRPPRLVGNDQEVYQLDKHLEQHIEHHLEYQENNNLDYTDFESQKLLEDEPYLKKYKL